MTSTFRGKRKGVIEKEGMEKGSPANMASGFEEKDQPVGSVQLGSITALFIGNINHRVEWDSDDDGCPQYCSDAAS